MMHRKEGPNVRNQNLSLASSSSGSKDGRDEYSAKETHGRLLAIARGYRTRAAIPNLDTEQECDQIPKCHVIVTQSR